MAEHSNANPEIEGSSLAAALHQEKMGVKKKSIVSDVLGKYTRVVLASRVVSWITL